MAKEQDTEAQKWEPVYANAAEQAFTADRKAIKALASKVQKQAYRARKSILWDSLKLDTEQYLLGEGGIQWREKFVPALTGTVTATQARWSQQMGFQYDVENLQAQEWFTDYQMQFAQPICQTTLDDVSEIALQAEQDGWSTPKMMAALDMLFDRYTSGALPTPSPQWFLDRQPPYRRELIARTESMRAANAGSYNLFKDWGAEKKEWIAARDSRTRDTHRTASSTYRGSGAIGMTDSFMVGGWPCQFPGDPNLPVKEFANCRCTVAPIVASIPDRLKPPAAPKPKPEPVTYQKPTRGLGKMTSQSLRQQLTAQGRALGTALRAARTDAGISNADAAVANKQLTQRRISDRLMGDQVFTDFAYGKRSSYMTLEEAVMDEVNDLVHRWAITSADTHANALAMQRAIEEEFGLQGTFKRSELARNSKLAKDTDDVYAAEGAAYRRFVRAMYNETQAMLTQSEYVLMRGMEATYEQSVAFPTGKLRTGAIELQPASSFSYEAKTASAFAASNVPLMLSAVVPKSRILGTFGTGFGCTSEAEFVVLGGKMEATVFAPNPGRGARFELQLWEALDKNANAI